MKFIVQHCAPAADEVKVPLVAKLDTHFRGIGISPICRITIRSAKTGLTDHLPPWCIRVASQLGLLFWGSNQPSA